MTVFIEFSHSVGYLTSASSMSYSPGSFDAKSFAMALTISSRSLPPPPPEEEPCVSIAEEKRRDVSFWSFVMLAFSCIKKISGALTSGHASSCCKYDLCAPSVGTTYVPLSLMSLFGTSTTTRA